MKFLFRLSIVALFLTTFAQNTFAATGFVDSPIWFTPEYPADGDMVKVSAVFRNDEKNPLTGAVLFYDNDLLLGKKIITISPNDVEIASVSFRIGAGDHSFSAQMSNLSESAVPGKSTPIALPIETAKLPKYFVSKSIPNPFKAQASGGEDASSQALLKQVDEIQTKVLDSLPVPVKETVSTSAKSLDSWRSDTATNFSEMKDSAEKKLDEVNKQKIEGEKKGTVSPSIKYVDTPLSYVKLWFYTVLAFVFDTPVIFYIVGLLIVFFVLRFIFNKIVRFIRRKRGKSVEE